MFFLIPAWLVVMAVVFMVEFEIYDRAARPAVYRAAKDAGNDEMGWFVWAIAVFAFPVTIIVYAIGSIAGSAKKVS